MIDIFFAPFALSVLTATYYGGVDALPASMEKMTVSRMRMADLESSATGYSYDSQRGQPASYVRYTNHGTGGYYDAPAPVRYVTYRQEPLHSGPTVIAALPGYNGVVGARPPGYVAPVHEPPRKAPLAPYFIHAGRVDEPGRVEIVDGDNEGHVGDHRGHDDEDDDDENDSDEDVDDDDDDDDEDDDDDDEEIHGGGEESHSDEESSHGEKGDKSYESHHSFDNGDKGEHHKDRHEGHYSEDAGNKASHVEAAGNYGQRADSEAAVSGESHGEKSYRNKGHKTTGYHNVYAKDEYKKDTDFYDDEHKSGHRDEHSSSDAAHSNVEGGHAKGARHESGYAESEKGKEGHRDEGHERSEHEGHRRAEGVDSYHKNHADYANRGAAEGGEKYGYDRRHK